MQFTLKTGRKLPSYITSSTKLANGCHFCSMWAPHTASCLTTSYNLVYCNDFLIFPVITLYVRQFFVSVNHAVFIYLLALWWDSRLQSLSPVTHFIKNASLSMPNKKVASILNRCKLLLLQCTSFKFDKAKLKKKKGDNAIIHAWALRGWLCGLSKAAASLSVVQT